MPRVLMSLVFVLVLLLAREARAEDTYDWLMPTPEEQLAQDRAVIPVGKGALFIPSISGAEHEPPATVVTDKEVVSVALGERVILPPGPYVVVISSGTPAQGVSVAVDVGEGETTLVPVTWGALRIEVTDDHRIPHRGSYEIIRADTREPVGTGFGADTLQGEILQTWLLPAGLYRIVKPGRDYRALRDYATVYIPPASFVRYRVVMDEDTGDFYGSGVLLPDEFSSGGPEHANWFRSMVLGIDGAMVHNENVVGVFNETQLTASGFLDTQIAYRKNDHTLSFLVQIEEGASQIRPQEDDPLPVVKAIDRLRGDALYTYDIQGSTGPYVRTSAESQAFPTTVLVTDDSDFVTIFPNGAQQLSSVSANETFRLSDSWEPTLLREGAGMNTSLLKKTRSVNFNFRLGFGMRQNLYGGALVLNDLSSTPEFEYEAVQSFYEEGIESTVVASLRLPGWVVYSTDLELFADFQTLMQPSASWRNTLSLRITRNVSLNYYANVDLEPQVIDKAQVQQSLLFRASWSIF
jgi:hypothetical protein